MAVYMEELTKKIAENLKIGIGITKNDGLKEAIAASAIGMSSGNTYEYVNIEFHLKRK